MTKFFMSLLMTPFADKLAIFIIGGQSKLEAMAEESEEYRANQRKGFGEMSTDWKMVLILFKLGVMIMLYFYSSNVRNFRENADNFEDHKGMTRVLEGFLRRNQRQYE